MAALPASGGVRSLLAKFENSNNNNNNNNHNNNADMSPSRGRTSGESQDSATNRPLSKVRASFVSVERNGQGSPTPGALRRTESYNTDVDSNQRSTTVSPARQLETASASPFSPSPHKIRTALAAFQGDKIESASAKLASLAVKDNVPPPPVTGKSETKPETKSDTKPELLEPVIIEKTATKPTPATSNKQATPSKAIKKSASTMSIAKISSANKVPTRSATTKEKKPASTPTRSATTTTRPTAHLDRATSTRTTTVKNSAPTARTERSSTPSQEATKKHTVQPSPKTKPSSKSPTRPVRLPASLVTPTAASAARTGALTRSQSHVNLRSSPKAEPAKTLSRKPSTLRPDASRLSNHTIPDRPRSRMSTSSRAPAEESFLARMMRPTASSASKMHEKVEPRSPPRLGKAVKLSPKKEIPVKTVENKKERHGRPVQDSTPATPEVKIERVATDQNTIKEDLPVENGDQVEDSTASVVKETQKEAEMSAAEPSSESVERDPAVESVAEPSAESVIEDPKEEATTTEPLTEPNIKEELTENPPTESTLSEDPDAVADKGLVSVPETVLEEPEVDVKEAAVEITTEIEQPHDIAQDTVVESASDVTVPQEDISDKKEEAPEIHEGEAQESEQIIQDSVPAAPEGTLAEAVDKVEEPAQKPSGEESSLEPIAEKANEQSNPEVESTN